MRSYILLLSLGLLAACSSTPRLSDEQRLAAYEAHAGESVSSIFFSRNLNWTPVDDNHIVLWTRVNTSYLLALDSCPGLRNATTIRVNQSGATLSAGFDTISVLDNVMSINPLPCRIRSIRELDESAAREQLKELREAIPNPREVVSESLDREAAMTTPGDLQESVWSVTEVNGVATPGEVRPTLRFDRDGRLSGHAGCNRYSSSYTLDGERLELGATAATKMLCEQPRMQLESAFLQALGQLNRISVDAEGRLHGYGDAGRLLSATRQN